MQTGDRLIPQWIQRLRIMTPTQCHGTLYLSYGETWWTSGMLTTTWMPRTRTKTSLSITTYLSRTLSLIANTNTDAVSKKLVVFLVVTLMQTLLRKAARTYPQRPGQGEGSASGIFELTTHRRRWKIYDIDKWPITILEPRLIMSCKWPRVYYFCYSY